MPIGPWLGITSLELLQDRQIVSSGIRVGAWDYLHWGNIRPIEQDGKIVAARILVYADDDFYVTFITPLEYRELAEWIKYTEVYGEIITDDSWVCVTWGIHESRQVTD